MEPSFLRPPQMNAYFCRVSPEEIVKSRQIFKPLDTQQKPSQEMDGNSLQLCTEAAPLKTGDRLTVLHSRLHQEADKIRKWKTATDIELRQKEKHLQDANHSIENQKKALLELQVENEALSAKLHEEVTNQHEVRKRIETTREMCNALKDHICHVEQVLQIGANDRVELQKSGEQRYDQYKELVVKYHEMEHCWTERENSLLTAIGNEQALNDSLSVQLSSCAEEVRKLNEHVREREEAAESAKTQVEHWKDVEGKLKNDIQKLNADLLTYREELSQKDDIIKQLESTIGEQLERLDQFTAQTAVLQHEAVLTAESHNTELQLLLSKLTTIEDSKKQLSENTISLQQKVAAQILLIHQLEERISSATKETQVACDDITNLRAQIRSKEEELAETKLSVSDKVKSITEQLSIQVQEKCTIDCSYQKACQQIECMSINHASQLEKMKSDFLSAKNEVHLHESKALALEEELNERCQEVDSLAKEISVYKQDIMSQQAENVELNSRLQALSEESLKVQTEVLSLTMEINNKEMACNELREQLCHCKKVHADEIQCIIANNTSLNEKLEENKKKQDLFFQSHNIEVESYRKQLADLGNELRESRAENNMLEERSRVEILKVIKEHETSKCCFDSQVNELCAMLEKYKIENLKIVTQKDREIEAFYHRITEAEALKKKFEADVATFQVKLSELQNIIEAKDKELEMYQKPYHVSCTASDELTMPPTPSRRAEPCDETAMMNIGTLQSTPSSLVPNTPRRNVRSSTSRGTPLKHRQLMDITPRCNARPKKQPFTAKHPSREVLCSSEKSSNLCTGTENKKDVDVYEHKEHFHGSQMHFYKRTGGHVSDKKCSQQVAKKKQGKKLQAEHPDVHDTSWFDLDSVFGFGPND